MTKVFDVIIIGAGASGLACAMALKSAQKKVAIIEHNDKPLKKVLVSGGGRCNFTNLQASFEEYLPVNEAFVGSALAQFGPKDFVSLLHKHKIKFQEKARGQLFCTNGAKEIAEMLLCEAKPAQIFYQKRIGKVVFDKGFAVEADGERFFGEKLVVATGGMSYPQIGASDFGYRIGKQFGLKIVPYRPALVPFNLDSEVMKEFIGLKGVALRARVSLDNFSLTDDLLFTHFGLSGPAVLQASNFWQKGKALEIDLLPGVDVLALLTKLRSSSQKGKKISTILAAYLPKSVAEWATKGQDMFVTEASNKLLKSLSNKVNRWRVESVGTQGFRLAEVTMGGVDLAEIWPETFEAKKQKGLFFVGEVLDVTGQLGGYNLQWAWSSGFAAGKYIGGS